MFYAFRVNKALSDLGVRVTNVPADFRQVMQGIGKGYGFSPQETALFIASQMPEDLRQNIRGATALHWILRNQINMREPMILQMLANVGLGYLAKAARPDSA